MGVCVVGVVWVVASLGSWVGGWGVGVVVVGVVGVGWVFGWLGWFGCLGRWVDGVGWLDTSAPVPPMFLGMFLGMLIGLPW